MLKGGVCPPGDERESKHFCSLLRREVLPSTQRSLPRGARPPPGDRHFGPCSCSCSEDQCVWLSFTAQQLLPDVSAVSQNSWCPWKGEYPSLGAATRLRVSWPPAALEGRLCALVCRDDWGQRGFWGGRGCAPLTRVSVHATAHADGPE